jgi:hypothetical protein
MTKEHKEASCSGPDEHSSAPTIRISVGVYFTTHDMDPRGRTKSVIHKCSSWTKQKICDIQTFLMDETEDL